MASTMSRSSTSCESRMVSPWWRHGHVWLLMAGPLAVIVAGLWTAWLAWQGSDPVVEPDYYRRGLEINRTLKLQAGTDSAARARLPALQGRNHALTPVPLEPVVR